MDGNSNKTNLNLDSNLNVQHDKCNVDNQHNEHHLAPIDYKSTLNLFDSEFLMRADLAKREPEFLLKWYGKNCLRYKKLRQICTSQHREEFVLSDGPPYANGDIHLGHAVNRILKDLILRYKAIAGFDITFRPGWDCHGLPIELNVEKKFGRNIEPNLFRTKCREYAQSQVEIQANSLMHLGLVADWENPYLTADYNIEADIIRAIGKIYHNGYMYQGMKPVYWCLDCASALAEAEIEYYDKVSTALYVLFAHDKQQLDKQDHALSKRINQDGIGQTVTLSRLFGLDDSISNTIYACIWTTTPWTLPANLAICVGHDIEYSLIELIYSNNESAYIIVAAQQASNLMDRVNHAINNQQSNEENNSNNKDTIPSTDNTNKNNLNDTYNANSKNNVNHANKVLSCIMHTKTILGKQLEGYYFNHPFYTRSIPIILGDHVTTDTGTGLVHTAPGFGQDDYNVCKKYNITPICPVNQYGKYTADLELFAGMHILKANQPIIDQLILNHKLLLQENITHSYPCCWRHKSPIIFRLTKQWFIGMDTKVERSDNLDDQLANLRDIAMKEIDTIRFVPQEGRARLESMISMRPDWCISRQRSWGVPIPFLLHKDTNKPHPNTQQIISIVANLVAQRGINAWFELDLNNLDRTIFSEEIIPQQDIDNYIKLQDTLDVWFESGTTHFSVMRSKIADLYLEGSDQHRGWFQSSLLTSCAMYGNKPYKQLLTHGFTVDEKRRKMSKSLGNTILPQEITKTYGVDILRLWIATTDYTNEMAISNEILKRTVDIYRRIRNTIKFLLSNLVDFCYVDNAVINPDSELNDNNQHQTPIMLYSIDELEPLDQYALVKLDRLFNIVMTKYESYKFHDIVKEINLFTSEFLGGFYLDILKDRLYTTLRHGRLRRSAQYALYHITKSLLFMLHPILPFTTDEAWVIFTKQNLHNYTQQTHNMQEKYGFIKGCIQQASSTDQEDSLLYHTYNDCMHGVFGADAIRIWIDKNPHVEQKWDQVMMIRSFVLEALEKARISNIIGSSLQAEIDIILLIDDKNAALLQSIDHHMLKFIFIVSSVQIIVLNANQFELYHTPLSSNVIIHEVYYKNQISQSHLVDRKLKIAVNASQHQKCARCWHYSDSIGQNSHYSTLCARCVDNIAI